MKRFLMRAVLISLLPVASWAQAVPMVASHGSVTDLGSLAGLGSVAQAVSADGSVVAGYANTNYPNASQRAFRWTATGGMQDLDSNPNDTAGADAYGISADGSVIVGAYSGPGECGQGCAFSWPDGTPFQFLVQTGWYSLVAQGASKDGSIVAGNAAEFYGGPSQAWLWTGSEVVDLGNLPGSTRGAAAMAVSEDGTVVVGNANDATARANAFRWTQKTGMEPLGFLSGAYNSYATGVSSNGSVVVGYAGTNLNCGGWPACTAPFRWTKATGMVQLPFLPGQTNGIATGVSEDGKTVVGYAGGNCCWVAWRWTAATGTQAVSDWLAAVGVDASAFSFYSAYAVTANGEGVVGQLTTGDAYLALATSNKTGMPTFSPKPGKYVGAQSVTLSHTSAEASIYYTTDGSTPTVNSTPYTAPIDVTATTTIKAIAIVPGYAQSAVATGKYTIK
jgi:probable HAF family extracellular repeat protein